MQYTQTNPNRVFLDDERFPPIDGFNWDIVRSYEEFVNNLQTNGCPEFISFDHDLGQTLSGHDCAKWLINTDIEYDGRFIPANFKFYVHSQNPVGKANIEAELTNFLNYKKMAFCNEKRI